MRKGDNAVSIDPGKDEHETGDAAEHESDRRRDVVVQRREGARCKAREELECPCEQHPGKRLGRSVEGDASVAPREEICQLTRYQDAHEKKRRSHRGQRQRVGGDLPAEPLILARARERWEHRDANGVRGEHHHDEGAVGGEEAIRERATAELAPENDSDDPGETGLHRERDARDRAAAKRTKPGCGRILRVHRRSSVRAMANDAPLTGSAPPDLGPIPSGLGHLADAKAIRVAYVYAKSRHDLLNSIERGEAPDTGLLGQNHLAEHGIAADIKDSALRRRHRAGGVAHRLTWLGREWTIPVEAREYDAICSPLGPSLALASRASRGPKIVLLNMSLCQSLRRSTGTKRRMLAGGIRAATAVVCFADAQRESLVELSGARPERVHSLGLGVDERFLTARTPPPRDGIVLAVGRDLARDHSTFAAAVQNIDAPIVLVTSARNLEGVRLPPHVEVRLDTSPVELRELYDRASCVVVSTRVESFPWGADCSGQTVILDAFAMSRPVVASERATLRGYVDNGRNGLICPAEDPIALRESIERILDDPDLARRLGECGRADVEERFTTRRLAESIAAVLRGAIG